MFKEHELINGQYEVQRTLAGGMGYVYIVHDQVTGNQYAIKTIKDAIQQSPEACQRFEREARTWINLGLHPNIVHAVTFHRGKQPLLLLEYIQGPNLRRLLSSEPGGLDFYEIYYLALQIAKGLDYAHSHVFPGAAAVGVVHRDLKPDNVMITTSHMAKLTDFGLAKARDDSALTAPCSAMGTLPYMPPEQFMDARTADGKSDLYSFGVMLYEMVTGARPFSGSSSPELMHKIFHTTPAPVEELRGGVSHPLALLIRACMQKDAAARPVSARPVIDQLEELIAKERKPAARCRVCGYVPRKQHMLCPLCGAERVEEVPTQTALQRCVCGEEMPQDYRFCLSCGRTLGLPAGEVACPACGSGNPPGFQYCQSCGNKLPLSPSPGI